MHVLLHGDPPRPWGGALLVTGVSLLLTSPSYYRYGHLVVALAALDGHWEWLAVPLAGPVLCTGDETGTRGGTLQTAAYAAAAVTVAVPAALRRWHRFRRTRQDGGGTAAKPFGNSRGGTVDTHVGP